MQAGQALWGAAQWRLLNAATEPCSRSLSLSLSEQLAPSGPIGGSGTVGSQVLEADPLLLSLAALRPWVEVTLLGLSHHLHNNEPIPAPWGC